MRKDRLQIRNEFIEPEDKTSIKDQFLSEKEAIKYIKQHPDGNKISFSAGFQHAMKLIKQNEL